MPKATPYFSPASFAFLRALAANNSREWFTANKGEYEQQVKLPFLRLIADLDAPLKAISPHYVANPKPVGGSMFRIHRDTRFAADKTPYKPWAGASFYHQATRAVTRGGDADQGTMGRLDAPGFYLHMKPGDSFLGGGIWHPQPETLKRIRAYLVNNPASWKKATRSAAFQKAFGELSGESAKRVPLGYDAAHELIEDIKRKDYICAASLSDEAFHEADLPKLIIQQYKLASPLIDWLCGALDLDY
ncbi:DUF2461 domain-containing protein [Nevskia sp.]|uniref:DUF2461 domain-containing protein n=1 Tax=Nevskia sp. TaxID=1929292 RepID=UPI0025D48606|nr:DUF2461 domain-containing protein [Nevskia sp.]